MTGRRRRIAFLTEELSFPEVEDASSDGLLAVGGDLSPERLLLAYQSGIFPWFNEDPVILWWSPDPRMVLFPEKLKVSKSMRKIMRENTFTLTQNEYFHEVVKQCAEIPRPGQGSTWITESMQKAYVALYEKGIARSYEVWQEGKLVGGLYGIDLGHVFCGESMFSLVDNASKFAFIKMVEDLRSKNYALIDCQVYTSHLESLGAEEIPRKYFLEILKGGLSQNDHTSL